MRDGSEGVASLLGRSPALQIISGSYGRDLADKLVRDAPTVVTIWSTVL